MRRRVHEFIVANNFMLLSLMVALSLVVFIACSGLAFSSSFRFSMLAFAFYGGIIAFTEATFAPESVWGDIKFLRFYISIGSLTGIIYSAAGIVQLITR